MFAIAFSFIFSMVRSVRKSYNVSCCQQTLLPYEVVRLTNHEALCDIRRCCAIRLVFVRLADLERVDDGREPIDELVEVHARCVLARGGRPVVL